MNPATFLRVLGPEPWNVAYVEPSIRPDDGRYGENPYRMQQHYQFQVILKPDPGNPQELYLLSLKALGIDPQKHDIRFVEDNWEAPALGSWGLGWEVWLDGQEITQFTYFQQAGRINLEPVSVEITYGLERIAMALQKNYNFKDIRWNKVFTYGEINLQGEQEHSKYYFEDADVARLRKMYDLFEKEAQAALDKGLVLPAYDYLLKCSHTFNVLDTRSAIGVTERQTLFSSMRDLSKRVAETYINQRQELEYPWLEKTHPVTAKSQVRPKQAALTTSNKAFDTTPQRFLLEIGTEELPASDLKAALIQLTKRVPVLLNEIRLTHGEINVMGTPRRLVISIEELASKQEDTTQTVKGPPAKMAFDEKGKPTKAAEGFAKGIWVPLDTLRVEEINGGKYLVADVHQKGALVFDVLPPALVNLLANIHFEKSMRWNDSSVAFSRPIRWLLTLFGKNIVKFEYAGLTSGRITRGLHFQEPETFEVVDPTAYLALLRNQGIFVNPQERKERISTQVRNLIRTVKGADQVDQILLEEVTNLVEAPTALLGSFDKKHLELPKEVLISVMKKHQRYFPIKQADGNLLPNFITVRNGDNQHLDIVARGNEEVIEARFADAAFFIEEDRKFKLEKYLLKLNALTFHAKLGSMLDKAKRIEKSVEEFVKVLGINKEETKTTLRAAHLCKADLVTNMVVEMTALQGTMGRYYAKLSGESQAVADAIGEHYLPRFSGDEAPKSKAGLIIGLADRLDSLTGLFAVGMAPSGTKDAFGLRRTAIGLVQNLIKWELDFDLKKAAGISASHLPIKIEEKTLCACLKFITGRLDNTLREQGFRYDVVAAVLCEQGNNSLRAYQAVNELSIWVEREDWNTILPAYARCVRITRDLKDKFDVRTDKFTESEEKSLYKALQKAQGKPHKYGSVNDMLNNFLPLIPNINAFFNKVLVMCEDKNLRQNRLGLLQDIAALTCGVADFSKLEGF